MSRFAEDKVKAVKRGASVPITHFRYDVILGALRTVAFKYKAKNNDAEEAAVQVHLSTAKSRR